MPSKNLNKPGNKRNFGTFALEVLNLWCAVQVLGCSKRVGSPRSDYPTSPDEFQAKLAAAGVSLPDKDKAIITHCGALRTSSCWGLGTGKTAGIWLQMYIQICVMFTHARCFLRNPVDKL